MTKLLKTGPVCLSLQGHNPSEEIHKVVWFGLVFIPGLAHFLSKVNPYIALNRSYTVYCLFKGLYFKE